MCGFPFHRNVMISYISHVIEAYRPFLIGNSKRFLNGKSIRSSQYLMYVNNPLEINARIYLSFGGD